MAERQVKKYAAFISYRHLSPDMEIAQELHRMLEHNQVRPDRHAPRNIRPVFLDTGELPILEDLDAGILEALENSECLYVICSPNLPLSKYCMREIDYFKKIHGGSTRRIYTLLVAGEPMESFPQSLREQTKLVRGEDGVERAQTVDAEPLFADVRAPSLRESIRKLRKTEFLRLAAAYYGCSYDELYKRRLRWLIKMGCMAAAGVLAVAAGFALYAHVRNMQYDTAKAATYASYAQDAADEGDELLAMTLCEEGWAAARASRSQQYMTALRSAFVQHDYQSRALDVAPVMQTAYVGTGSEVFYLSGDGSKIITVSDSIFQITDAKTGGVLLRRPTDSVAVDPDSLTEYAVIEAVQDAQGVFQDTVTLRSMADNSVLGSFAFRPSGLNTPSYKLVYLSRDHGVMALVDGNEPVAYMDAKGKQLTQAEAEALAGGTEEAQEAPFYVAAGKRKKPAAVKNSAGETMLELPASNLVTAFSPDYARFAYVQDGVLTVYETEGFAKTAECPIGGDLLQNLYLLRDTDYALLVFRTKDWWWRSEVIDWRSGEKMADIPGSARAGSADSSIYSMDGGVMTRSVFNDWSGEEAFVLAQCGSLCYADAAGAAVLADAERGEILLRVEGVDPKSFFAADDLSRLMLRTGDGLACYDAAGRLCFVQADAQDAFAVSADGSMAAWMDAQGGITVASAQDGAVRYTVPAQAGWVYALAVGPGGLCAAGSDGARWLPEGGESVYLGEYDGVKMTADGLLILESSMAYVMDFAVYDTKTNAFVLRPQENTGEWAYAAKTGMLVRRVETSGSHPSLEMEVLRIRDGAAQAVGRIALPDLYISSLHMDAAGETLSVTAGETTTVYRLKDCSQMLRVKNTPVICEGGRFWSGVLYGARMYSTPVLEGEALHAAAQDAITGTAGMRTLSLEERSRFSFEP